MWEQLLKHPLRHLFYLSSLRLKNPTILRDSFALTLRIDEKQIYQRLAASHLILNQKIMAINPIDAFSFGTLP
jgi:hypothetical protein